MNCEICCSSSVKNAIGNLIAIALNLRNSLFKKFYEDSKGVEKNLSLISYSFHFFSWFPLSEAKKSRKRMGSIIVEIWVQILILILIYICVCVCVCVCVCMCIGTTWQNIQ